MNTTKTKNRGHGDASIGAGLPNVPVAVARLVAKKIAKQAKQELRALGGAAVEQPKKLLFGGKAPGRWVPGQSGNPHGRAKGRIELGQLIRKFLGEVHPAQAEAVVNRLITREQARTRLQVLVEDLVETDPRTVLAYGYGKPVETIELGEPGSADGDKPAELEPKRMAEVVAWLDQTAPREGQPLEN